MPDKSGLPSAVRGAGAVRFGFPFDPFGTPGFGYNGHCAESDEERTATAIADTRTVNGRFISASSLHLKSVYVLAVASLRSRSVCAGEQLLTRACQGDRLSVGVGRSVLRSSAFDGDDVAGFERQPRPA